MNVSKQIALEPFLFQTGDLTIRGYDMRDYVDYYELDFRNEQTRTRFFRTFLRGLTELDPLEVSRDGELIKQKLEELDMCGFISEIYIHISRIPIQLRQRATLHYYLAVFYLLLENFGLEARIEHDCTRIEIGNVAGLFQFTFNKTAETAYEQASKLYKNKISHDKKTFCVGVNFALESYNIYDWRGALYEGEHIVRNYAVAFDDCD